jgi:NAD(P)-dependent dehydrogenase (short-subunit alcohol dehydrogenase family)
MGIVVVTGTSTGIGQATAITLARGGHKVFAGMRNLDRGGKLRESSLKEKLPINIVQLDVDSDNSVEDAFKQILSEKGQIDVLVNNAGIGARGYIEEAPIAAFRQVMETNFFWRSPMHQSGCTFHAGKEERLHHQYNFGRGSVCNAAARWASDQEPDGRETLARRSRSTVLLGFPCTRLLGPVARICGHKDWDGKLDPRDARVLRFDFTTELRFHDRDLDAGAATAALRVLCRDRNVEFYNGRVMRVSFATPLSAAI